ncbi:MAG TPA: LuxR C-terminal-related transcriptional regulator, partial [Herpetosiphonaceae bacterium]|nr:LuxR C-terminal-related transcriptional regulator [Herpetosiphonaceae bacterium]
ARGVDRLSDREYQVLQMIAEGQTNSEIAKRLQIAVKTVEKHRGSLMAKLQVHSVAGLMRIAMQHGLIVPEP